MARRVYHGSNRKQRMRQVPDGSGYFVYNGKAVAREYEPTPLLTKDRQVMVSDSGQIVRQGNMPVYEPAGRPVMQMENGKKVLVLGGEPIEKVVSIETFKLWGAEFPAGQKIFVEDPTLAMKLRRMAHFDELKEDEEPKPEKKKLPQPDPKKAKEDSPEAA